MTPAISPAWPTTDTDAMTREERKAPATLLVVDDTEANRYALARILKNAGFNVIEAGHGAEALTRVASARPDLVVLDVKLPDIPGWDVCRQIKSNPATALVSVLHVSASYVTEQDRAHGLNQGADGYLTQPIEPGVLVATVRALLRLKRTTEALTLAEGRLETVLTNTPGMVFAVDSQGICTLAKGRALESWQLSPTALIGRPFADAVAHDGFRASIARALGGDRFIDELRLDDRWYELCFAPLPLIGVESAGFVCLVNDITERRRGERMRERLLAQVANDLRNPLYGIKLTAAALKQHLQGSGAASASAYVSQAVGKVVRLADQANRFIGNLGDYEQLQSGTIAIHRRNHDVRRLLWEAIEIMQPVIDSRSITLDRQGANQSCVLSCDGDRLLQVFTSGLGHAIQYTPARGTVQALLAVDPNEVSVIFEHDGHTIAETTLPHTFNPPRSSDVTGEALVGLGLSLAQGIVSAHGGRIETHNSPTGRARICYILPRLLAAES